MSEPAPDIVKLEKQLRMLEKKLERSEWHRVDLENQHDRDQHLYRRLQSDLEAANREAQIEASLERVRARAMAMRSSDELREMVLVILNEMKALAFPSGRCTIVLFDRETGDADFWMSGLTDDALPERYHVPYHELPTYKALHDGWREGTPFFEIELAGEVKREQDRFFHEETEFRRLPEPAKEGMRQFGDIWLSNAATTHGVVQAVGAEPLSSEDAAILQRFARVIDLTYTRVEDIQQSEAQVREAQIETALERVRSRTMGMQTSDELREVVATVYEQLHRLGVDAPVCMLATRDDGRDGYTIWMANLLQARAPESYHVSPLEHPVYKRIMDAWDAGVPYLVTEVDGADKQSFGRVLFEETEMGRLAEPVKAAMLSLDRVVLSTAFTRHSFLEASGPRALSDEDAEVLQRVARVFDQAYTRFLDLQQAEARAREAEIEAALERIRSRTMGMQSSDELAEVSLLLDQEVRALGTKTWGCAFNIYGEGESTEWFGSEAGVKHPYPTPREDFFLRFYEKGQQGETFHVEVFEGEECAAHYAYMLTLPVLGEMLAGIRSAGHEFPASQIDHVAYFKYGYLLFITLEPAPEAHDVFQRFAKVFEQTYTRYLDLKQAEEQAREAQIEAALERVRSRSLAMQSSDELGEISHELVKQVQALGVDTWHCAFHVYDEGEESSTEWGANADGYYPTYTIPRVGVFRRYYKIGQSGVDLHVETIGEDRCAEHYDELCTIPGVGDVLLGLKAEGVPFPESQVDHVAFFKYGYLIFVTFEPAPEAHDVFGRFAKVFEQSYTRFLDLKRAEEQAREARIETALERVRSRTMGMQSSDELKDIIGVVNEQITSVGLHVDHAGFIIDYKNREDMHIYLADPNEVASEVTIPYFDSAHFNSLREAKRNGTQVFTNELDFEEKNAFYEQLFELIPGVPDEAKAFYRQCPALSISTVLLDNVGLYVENFSGRPYTEEDNETILRFGKVFQQAYTRFLDLQRAEARAREAEIEAALERVRSRALAMTSSDELLDVVFKIHREYAGLGLPCGAFWHTRYTPESYHKALTGVDGQKLAAIMELPRDFASNPALEAWERGNEKVGVFPFDADAACTYLGHMIAKGKYKEVDPEAFTEEMIRENDGWTFVQARTSHGEIGYSLWGETEPSQEAKAVLVRFATTFDLAYRRFLDLQRAEADHKALVEEKAATDRALAELRATQAQLVQKEKMASLGQLTAGIAHEIKNPLNFVNNFAQLSKELVDELAEVDTEAERDEILVDLRQNAAKIEEHGRRADAIVRAMMEHARSGSGPHRPVALNALVDEHAAHALHAARVRHPEFRPTLDVRLGDGVGEVVIEPQEIGRVLVNLVDNALHAARQRAEAGANGYVPTVTVSTRHTEAGVQIRVEDNGTGMPDDVRAKVFEPFFTTKPTGQGTGLGLSLSHDIVAQGHGGALTVESAEGEGTTFVLTLPAP